MTPGKLSYLKEGTDLTKPYLREVSFGKLETTPILHKLQLRQQSRGSRESENSDRAMFASMTHGPFLTRGASNSIGSRPNMKPAEEKRWVDVALGGKKKGNVLVFSGCSVE